jgi:hypothetical protein
MNKEFVPYQPSIDMKGLGFDEPCFGYYVDGELRGINLGVEEYERCAEKVINKFSAKIK